MTRMTNADDQVSMMAQIEDLTRRLSAVEDMRALA